MRQKIVPCYFDNYLALIKNSVKSNFFRNSYFKINGEKVDILKNGDLSCAFFVSVVLYLTGLIKTIHSTVSGAVADMEKAGWNKIKRPKIGCVIIWEAKKSGQNGERHPHIGFYLGGKKAISNSSKLGCPQVHHWTFGRLQGRPRRKIEKMYWHFKLGE